VQLYGNFVFGSKVESITLLHYSLDQSAIHHIQENVC